MLAVIFTTWQLPVVISHLLRRVQSYRKKVRFITKSIGIYMRVSRLGLLSHRIIYGWLLGIFQLRILRRPLFWHTDLLGIRV